MSLRAAPCCFRVRFRPANSPAGRVPCPAGVSNTSQAFASRAPSASPLPVNSQPFRLTPSAVRAYTLSRGRLRLHRSGCPSGGCRELKHAVSSPRMQGLPSSWRREPLRCNRRGGFFVAARPLILPPPLPSGNSQRVRVPVVRHGRKGRGCPSVRGVNRVPPARVHRAFGEQDNGGGNAAGHARIVPQFGSRVLSCTSDIARKKRLKSYFKITFCPAECLPRNTKKGGHCPAQVISPPRRSSYRGTFSPPSSSYSTTSPAASACAPFPSCALLRSAASRAV